MFSKWVQILRIFYAQYLQVKSYIGSSFISQLLNRINIII